MGCRAQVVEGAIEARTLLTQKHKDLRQNGHDINWLLGSGKMKTFFTNCFGFLYEA